MPEPPDPPALNIDRIIEVFGRHGVDYLLVGGVASRLYGAERLTFDVDVLARHEIDNLDRVADALTELGAFLRVSGLDDEEARALPVILDGAALTAFEISTWRTDAGDIDVLAHLRDAAGRRVSSLISRVGRARSALVALRSASQVSATSSSRSASRIGRRTGRPYPSWRDSGRPTSHSPRLGRGIRFHRANIARVLPFAVVRR